MKKRLTKKLNPYALALRVPLFKPKIVKPKKGAGSYRRGK